MKCDECGKDISGTYFETEGKIICKEDYDEVPLIWLPFK